MAALHSWSAVTEYLQTTTSRDLSSLHSFINIVNKVGSGDAGQLGCYNVSTKKLLLIKDLS
jgi:hypothetical protein